MLSVEELGYPHELILSASNRTPNIFQETYRTRIKLFANLLNLVLDKKVEKIVIDKEDNPVILLLESLTHSHASVDQHILKIKEKIEHSLEDFEETESESSYELVKEQLKEGLFIHVLCRQLQGKGLFVEQDFVRYSKILDYTENSLKAVFSAIQVWEHKKYTNVPHSIIVEFNSCNDAILQESMIFLSYVLAVAHPESKQEILMAHFMLVRKIVEKFSEVVSQEKLADNVLESLLRISIILSMCGYMNTLRLPNDEKIRYVNEVLHFPSIEYSVRKSYDEEAKISLPYVQIKLPYWLLLAFDSIFILIHAVNEVYWPWEISQLGIKLEIPEVPVFLLFSFIISSVLAFRVYSLKNKIIKNVRKGINE